jgi:glyoxalase/bleomycin resistance protein/dioxygenase superfamily protein
VRFHHVGYAVTSISDYLESFFVPLFTPIEVSPIVEDSVQRVRVAFATLTGGEVIELIEPMDDSSPVSQYLTDRRGGLYHLCYSTDSLEEAIEQFRSKRCMVFSGPTPAAAFEGRRIAFLFTPQRDIIELVESGLPG